MQSNLAVELGMNDDQVAWLNLGSTVIGAAGCIVGGLISDRIDRRRALNVYILLMALPVLGMMMVLQQYNWIMPVAMDGSARPLVAPMLITAFWIATLTYGFFQGLMYSTTMAIYMDVTNPAVAGTQFTAYMAMSNLTISYSATWQGIAIEALGYPKTMLLDAMMGVLILLLLPLTRRRATDPAGFTDQRAPHRARGLARGLALMCLLWVPVHLGQSWLGSAQPIVSTLFTLVFIGSTLFLLAGSEVLGASRPALARACRRFAPLLLLLLTRNYQETLAGWLEPLLPVSAFNSAMEVVYLALPVCAAALLWQLGRQHWADLQPAPAAEVASA